MTAKTRVHKLEIPCMSADLKKSLLELAQECVSRSPVIILGSGASAAYGIPGMPQLKAHLQKIACPSTAKPDEAKQMG